MEAKGKCGRLKMGTRDRDRSARDGKFSVDPREDTGPIELSLYERNRIGGRSAGRRERAGRGILVEGDHIVVEPDDRSRAIYTLHGGLLEFDAPLTFGRTEEE